MLTLRCLRYQLLVLFVLAVSGCCPCFYLAGVGPLTPLTPAAHLAVAHRGSVHREAPDNSLAAFRESMTSGVSFLEVDVRRSDAGDLFLFHDGSLSLHNSNAPRELLGARVQGLSIKARNEISLGSRAALDHIPTLLEALNLAKGSSATLQLDFKGESDALVLQALELARSENQLHQVLLQIRSSARLKVVREHFPQARLLARCLNMQELQEALNYGVEFVELERWISSEAILLAHGANAKVLINVSGSCLDERTTWKYLRSRGVDTIMTDFADQALGNTPQ